jgi:prepilin-type N-terminal cleavage/methylation domain-containing protein
MLQEPPATPVVRRRRGFTLVELIIVIAIIGTLAALTVGVLNNVIDGQRQSNTETTMRSVYKVLQQQWAQVVDEAKKEPYSNYSLAVKNLAKNKDGTDNRERARVIWIKVRLMEAFPQTFSEIQNPSSYIPANARKYTATYQSILNQASLGNNQAATQSSACLFMALSINRSGVVLSGDTLGSSAIADTDGDGLKEIVDGWAQPLAFFRFPTGNAELRAMNPSAASPTSRAAKFADPLDPNGTLVAPSTGTPASSRWDASNWTTFKNDIHKPSDSAGIVPAYYVIPVLVSAGPNGTLGLDNTMMVTSQNDADDNIYGFRLRLDMRGD